MTIREIKRLVYRCMRELNRDNAPLRPPRITRAQRYNIRYTFKIGGFRVFDQARLRKMLNNSGEWRKTPTGWKRL